VAVDGHGDWVTSVCISNDGSKIVSGSSDKTIEIWNSSGVCENTLEGHRGRVSSVCLSSNGYKIVSGSNDQTIKVWDVKLADCVMTLNEHGRDRHNDDIISIRTSSDDLRIMSQPCNTTIKIWDVIPRAVLKTCEDITFKVVLTADMVDVSTIDEAMETIKKYHIIDDMSQSVCISPRCFFAFGTLSGRLRGIDDG
jgi:WD40 repeat protein